MKLTDKLKIGVLATSLAVTSGCNPTRKGQAIMDGLAYRGFEQFVTSSVRNKVNENYRQDRGTPVNYNQRSINQKPTIVIYEWRDFNDDNSISKDELSKDVGYNLIDNGNVAIVAGILSNGLITNIRKFPKNSLNSDEYSINVSGKGMDLVRKFRVINTKRSSVKLPSSQTEKILMRQWIDYDNNGRPSRDEVINGDLGSFININNNIHVQMEKPQKNIFYTLVGPNNNNILKYNSTEGALLINKKLTHLGQYTITAKPRSGKTISRKFEVIE